MFEIPWGDVVTQSVSVLRIAAIAVWDAIAAEPKLQLMLLGFIALSLATGGGARGRARRAY